MVHNESNQHAIQLYIKCELLDYTEQVDLKILDSNGIFCELIGHDPKGKLLSAVILDIVTLHPSFLKACKTAKQDKMNIVHDNIISFNNKSFRAEIINEADNILILLFNEFVSLEQQSLNLQQLVAMTGEFLKSGEQEIDYQKIVDIFVNLCIVKYAVFNLFNEDGSKYTTVGFSGGKNIHKIVTKILGFEVFGKEWDTKPVYYQEISESSVLRFNNMKEITGNELPDFAMDLVSHIFKVGEVFVFSIKRYNRVLGEFTVFVEKGHKLQDQKMAELYTNQVGLLLTRHQSERSLRRQNTLVNTMIKSIKDIVVISDMNGDIQFLNKITSDIIHDQSLQFIGMSVFDAFKCYNLNESSPLVLEYKRIYKDNESLDINNRTLEVSRNNQKYYFDYSITPLMDEMLGGLGYLLIMRDTTRQNLEHNHVEYLSKHDQLTGLYNRRYFEEVLVSVDKKENLPISIIMGDVNGLKLINDSFGHVTGDELLVKAAKTMKKCCDNRDVLARIGGDEFVIIMPRSSEYEAEKRVNQIQEAAKDMKIMGTNLSISFGYNTKNSIEEPLSKIFYSAEEHMYKNKLLESASMHSKTLDLVVKSLYEKNEREMHHSKRVGDLSAEIAKGMGYNNDSVKRIAVAGLMHDIGKIGIPEEILNKRGPLTENEFIQIKRHSEIGYRILSCVNEFADISQYVLEHHERFDGKGYPKGLKEDEIHPFSKIICVADAYDAMTHERTYGSVMSHEEAIRELKDNMGAQFDAKVVRAIIEVLGR